MCQAVPCCIPGNLIGFCAKKTCAFSFHVTFTGCRICFSLLIFLYVSVICLAAVVVVAYARSQSVGLSSRQVFEDLEKLGADHGYLRRILRSQIQKVYFLPTLVGGLGILAFEILMCQINDGRLTKQELKMLPVLAVITLIMMAFQYLMYRASLHKVQKELSLL